MATQPPMDLPSHMTGTRDTNAVVAVFDEELAQRRAGFSTAVAALFDDEPVRDELLRLRSASHTRCEYCGNIRKRAAHDAGLGEDAVQGMREGRRDHLGAKDQAALVLAEAFYHERPADLDEVADVLGQDEVAAVLLDLVRFGAGGHAMVVLGLEPERQPRVLV